MISASAPLDIRVAKAEIDEWERLSSTFWVLFLGAKMVPPMSLSCPDIRVSPYKNDLSLSSASAILSITCFRE